MELVERYREAVDLFHNIEEEVSDATQTHLTAVEAVESTSKELEIIKERERQIVNALVLIINGLSGSEAIELYVDAICNDGYNDENRVALMIAQKFSSDIQFWRLAFQELASRYESSVV